MTINARFWANRGNVTDTYILMQRCIPSRNCLITVELDAGRGLPQMSEWRVCPALGSCLPSRVGESGEPTRTVLRTIRWAFAYSGLYTRTMVR